MHQLKYRGWHALAAFMAERMSTVPLTADVRDEVRWIVPVPTTRARVRQRGYNQAARIARELARLLDRRAAEWLVRAGASGSQTTLQPAARRANVAGAFRPAPGAEAALRGEHVLLVDDVLTTGATAGECASALVATGARCVSVLTFARALDARRLTMT